MSGADDRPSGDVDAALRRARVENVAGLVVPFLANNGMRHVAPRRLRWFGVGAGVVLTTVAVASHLRGRTDVALAAAAVHGALVVAGIADPRLPEYPARAWLAFGALLGRVVSWPVFAVFYFVVVTPTALLVRLVGKDPLGRDEPRAKSYWRRREPGRPGRHERQF